MTKFVTIKELKDWKNGGWNWEEPDDWPSRVFDTFVEMEECLLMAKDPELGLHHSLADDIKRLIEQIEPEDE